VQHFLHKRFDHLHWEHHARPWDGEHINGRIMDTLPFSIAFAAMASFFPIWSMPVLIAGLLQSYVVEEWVHHSVHFYHFDNPYFRYIKRHHLYHHSPKGGDVGYGLTNGFWDIIFTTRISAEQRRLLYARTRTESGDDRRASGQHGAAQPGLIFGGGETGRAQRGHQLSCAHLAHAAGAPEVGESVTLGARERGLDVAR
jgi:sterol desaturase/sphingolipid hydroxylase (fatty acid hydroxylase superfamily)